MRILKEANIALEEQAEERITAFADLERQHSYELNELNAKQGPLRQEADTLRQEREERARLLKTAQERLSEREVEVGNLQTEVLRLQAQTGDTDTLALIKRELTEQVTHIRSLESQATKNRIELKQLREQRRAVEIVEEEKRALESKLQITYDLRKDLDETRLQKQILEDERASWSSFLEGEDLNFDSPEALARAFVHVRLESLSLVDQRGKMREELDEKHWAFRTLEDRCKRLEAEVEKANSSNTKTDAIQSGVSASESKLRNRLDRQRVLAVKEVEYLRAQLKMFDTEESEMSPEKYDAQKAERISSLESLIDQYRQELQTFRVELEKAEQATSPSSALEPKTGNKRARIDDGSEADSLHASSTRQTRALQDELTQVMTARESLERELAAIRSQVTSLQSKSRTRVLEFRNNPTATFEAIKQSTLDTLRTENEALLARLENNSSDPPSSTHGRTRGSGKSEKLVPASTVERLRGDLAEKDRQLASRDKARERLLSSFKLRSLEFREAVASILGWKLDIMPNGRVRVRSMFDPVAAAAKARQKEKNGKGKDDDELELDEERSIVFDGEAGTMKISGGPASEFAREVRGHIEYWVDGRKEVPCFLAAVTMDFWERGVGTVSV